MKQITKTYTFLGLAFLIGLTSCKENADMLMYDKTGGNYIYFGLPYKQNQYGTPQADRVDSMAYTFAFELPSVNKYTFKVPVNISGMSRSNDRTYTIEIDQAKTTASASDYEPIKATQVIRSGRIVDTIEVTVKKTAELSKIYKNIVLKLISGDEFKLGTKEYLSAKLSFTNILTQPSWWNTWQSIFGPYSKEKYQIWINTYRKGLDPTPDLYDATKTYAYNWENMPTSTYSAWYPVTYMYIKQMKDYLIANPTYVDNDPTKARVLIPFNF